MANHRSLMSGCTAFKPGARTESQPGAARSLTSAWRIPMKIAGLSQSWEQQKKLWFIMVYPGLSGLSIIIIIFSTKIWWYHPGLEANRTFCTLVTVGYCVHWISNVLKHFQVTYKEALGKACIIYSPRLKHLWWLNVSSHTLLEGVFCLSLSLPPFLWFFKHNFSGGFHKCGLPPVIIHL